MRKVRGRLEQGEAKGRETKNVWGREDGWGVGCNDSYSDDVALRNRHGIELCLTTTGAEHAKATVTAVWRSERQSLRHSDEGRNSWKQSRIQSEHRGER